MTAVLVAIVGGSGSGKTRIARTLLSELGPSKAALISEDSYYRDPKAWDHFDPLTYDFDHPQAKDHGLLIEHLMALKAGAVVNPPGYCFVEHRRQTGDVQLESRPLILVEGAHLLCTPDLAAAFDLRVFIDTPADIKFIRQLLRDQSERGRSEAAIIAQYLSTVRGAHERWIEPCRGLADLILEDQSVAVRLDPNAGPCPLVRRLLDHPLVAARD